MAKNSFECKKSQNIYELNVQQTLQLVDGHENGQFVRIGIITIWTRCQWRAITATRSCHVRNERGVDLKEMVLLVIDAPNNLQVQAAVVFNRMSGPQMSMAMAHGRNWI